MNKFKLGTNFELELLTGIEALNKKYKSSGNQITEVYGSIREHAWLAARPEFRLPDVTLGYLEKYVKKCNAIGVDFNYTFNSPSIGSKSFTLQNKDKIRDLVHYLEGIGVKRITVADMLLLDIIRNYIKSDISIEISTIAHVDTVTQMKYLRDTYKVDKICNNVLKNRSTRFLKNAAMYCEESGLELELMVNEFCAVGDDNSSTHCVFRDSCYDCHAQNITKKDATSYKMYPMSKCITARSTHETSWLKSMFVLPQDIERYNNIGIKNWKITGRTGTSEYLLSMAEAYLSSEYDDNLLKLWKPLETIYNGTNETEFNHNVNIEVNKLSNFLDKWFNDETFDCANELCGKTCTYCTDYKI